MPQLGLALAAQGGAHKHRQTLLGQLVGDQLAVGAVVQGGLHPEFLGDPHGGEDVVGPVGVALQGNLAVDHRQHGLQLHVEGGILSGQLVVPVALGLEQQLTQQRRHGHAGHGAFLHALTVAALGILAEGALHGGGLLQQHIVHPLAGQLQHREGAAHHVGTAGAGAGGGDAAAESVGECPVLGVDGVDGPQLGGQRLHHLVVVHALPAQALVVQADVAVGLHTAGGQQAAAGIDDGAALRRVDVGSDGGDAAAVGQQTAARNVRARDGLYVSVLDQQHSDTSLCCKLRTL